MKGIEIIAVRKKMEKKDRLDSAKVKLSPTPQFLDINIIPSLVHKYVPIT